MGENPNQIEREIRQERSDLDRNLRELQDKTRALADWREHHRNHPGLFLGLAFGAGMALGLATVPQMKRVGRSTLAERDTSHDPLHPVSAMSSGNAGTRALARRQVSETWHDIADALLRVASARAVEFVGELIPGFRDQFGRHGHDDREYPSYEREPRGVHANV
jgi:hypothetical protein